MKSKQYSQKERFDSIRKPLAPPTKVFKTKKERSDKYNYIFEKDMEE